MLGPLARNYAIFAHNDGRSQEALDYLESYFPGISDHKNFRPSNWDEFLLQYNSVIPLMHDLLDDAEAKELLEDAIANARTFGANYEDYDSFYLWFQYLLYGHNAGKAVIMERYAVDKPVFLHDWLELLRNPWLTDLTGDPQVAAVIAAREERIAEIREEMRAVIERPEWRDDIY
jgi:hypothetical protein